MRRLRLLILPLGLLALSLVLSGPPVQPSRAQDGASDPVCDTLVNDALAEIANTCLAVGRNEACFGAPEVSVVLRDPDLFFEAPGDIVSVSDLETVITRPADPEAGTWGIVLMDVQADLPDSSDGAVRILLFGDSSMTPARPVDETVTDRPTCDVTNALDENINMRLGPGLSFAVVDVFDQGTDLVVYGRNDDWLVSTRGWIYAPLVTTDCDLTTLDTITETSDRYAAPMQAFSVTMTPDATCQSAPSGMLIQTPSGQTANLMVNGVELRLGSTAYITTRGGGEDLEINSLDGDVRITVNNNQQYIPQGGKRTVPLDGSGSASGTPSDAQPIGGDVQGLGTQFFETLPGEVAPPAPWNPAEESTPEPTLQPWGDCGSCDTCGFNPWECVQAPDGSCVWDPYRCATPEPPTEPTVTCSAYCGQSGVVTSVGNDLNFDVTYNAVDDSILSGCNAMVGDPALFWNCEAAETSATYTVGCQFSTEGMAVPVTMTLIDSVGRRFDLGFSVICE